MQLSPVPPAPFCRVDRVLCMFKNLEPPTRPSAIVAARLESICRALMQSDSSDPAEVCSHNFLFLGAGFWVVPPPPNYSKEGERGCNKSFLQTALLSLLESRNEDEVGITTLQRADNRPPLPPSLPLICCKRICGPGFGMAAVQGTKLPSTPYLFALDTRVVANLPQEDNISL